MKQTRQLNKDSIITNSAGVRAEQLELKEHRRQTLTLKASEMEFALLPRYPSFSINFTIRIQIQCIDSPRVSQSKLDSETITPTKARCPPHCPVVVIFLHLDMISTPIGAASNNRRKYLIPGEELSGTASPCAGVVGRPQSLLVLCLAIYRSYHYLSVMVH